jgi:hypothetical protein
MTPMLPQHAELCKSAGNLICGCVGSSANLTQAECEAWVSIYDKTGGPQWKNCKGSRLDPCDCSYSTPDWTRGITCGTDGAHITSVDLFINNLRGPLPGQELTALTGLTCLALSGNQLDGSIPPNISALTGLTNLALDNNHCDGSIPPEISALTGLTYLALNLNHFDGSIPPEISALSGLTSLALNENRLTGPVPALPFKNYTFCALQDLKNPTNKFECILPQVSISLGTVFV